MDYLELIKARERAISKLKKDYLELIEKAKEWTLRNGADPDRIIIIKACITYSDNIRGYRFSGSSDETIYHRDGAHQIIFSPDNEYLGKNVEVNGNDYHLEILVPRK